MKIAFLLAGIGRRMGDLTQNSHKSMIEIGGEPLLGRLIERFLANDQSEYVLAVGHCQDQLTAYLAEAFGSQITVTTVLNPKYDQYNNLHSLWLLREELAGQEFILCNGDVVLNQSIIQGLLGYEGQSAIAVDDGCNEPIDSPGTTVREGRIYDLGRHISFEQNGGYAIGLYKFNAELSSAFFEEAGRMLDNGEFQAGFHDPLPKLFTRFRVHPFSVQGLSWTDLDEPHEIPFVEAVLDKIESEERVGA